VFCSRADIQSLGTDFLLICTFSSRTFPNICLKHHAREHVGIPKITHSELHVSKSVFRPFSHHSGKAQNGSGDTWTIFFLFLQAIFSREKE
jgi:hypothetical protein